jgi:hypothetical protein
MSDKGSRGWSGRAPQTVHEDAIIHFTEPVTFGFFGSSPTRWSASEPGRSACVLGRSLLSLRTVRSVDMGFCIGSVRGSLWCRGRSVARARTVRCKGPDGPPQGPGRSALSLFFQKACPVRNNLRYSGQSI